MGCICFNCYDTCCWTVLAPIVGFGFGTALDQFWHGEDIFGIEGFSFNPGGKSIDEWIKEFLTELFGG